MTALRGLWIRRPGLSNPYVGPRAFGSDDRLYDRDRETRELFDLLIAERIVLLHAPSGAGHPVEQHFLAKSKEVWAGRNGGSRPHRSWSASRSSPASSS